MKNIVIMVIGLLVFGFSAEAQDTKKPTKSFFGGLIKFNHRPGDEIARYSHSGSYTTDTRVYARSELDSQWGFPASKLPPKVRNSETRVDLGRFQYERVQRGYSTYSIVGHDYLTGKTYHEATSHSSTNVYVYKEPAYRIPYHQLPDRGLSLSMPKGYREQIVGVVPLKPILTGPVGR